MTFSILRCIVSSYLAVVPNLWVRTPPRDHKMNLRGLEMICVQDREDDKTFFSNLCLVLVKSWIFPL